MSRADRVAGRLEDVDALLVTEPANVRYLTGFTGSNGFAVVGPRRAALRHRLPLRRAGQGRGAGLRPRAGAAGAARRAEPGCDGVARLGFDDAHLSVRVHRRLRELLPAASSWCPAAGVVEDVRAVKEPGEIVRIGAAAALVDEIYALAARARARRAHRARGRRRARARDAPARRVGAVLRLDRRLRRARRAAARDAARRADRARHAGDVDIGAVLDGYCSDCTRTWATGDGVRRAGRGLRARAARAGHRAGRGAARARRAARSTRSRAT